MRRFSAGFAMFYLVLFLGGPMAWAQPKEVKVKYRDRSTGKEALAEGTLKEESIVEVVVTLKTGKSEKKVPAVDILDVEYSPPIRLATEFRKARKFEEDNKVDDALKQFKTVAEMMRETKDPILQTYLEFKIALLQDRLAASNPADVKIAIDLLTKFEKAHPDSWQICKVPKMLVALHMKDNNLEEASNTLERFANNEKLPEEVREECAGLSLDILLKQKKFAEAETRLQALLKKQKGDSPQYSRLMITLAEIQAGNNKIADAEKTLHALLDRTTDPSIKARALNALGDCYVNNGNLREAMWNYLMVDVIYHQDKDEHGRAMFSLYKVFKELKEPTKAKQVADALIKHDEKYRAILQKEDAAPKDKP